MKTEVLKVDNLIKDAEKIARAAELLKNGEVVGIPTETVYGLAANALDKNAVSKIFKAKGRPQDNPLIVHISDMAMLEKLVEEIPDSAMALAEKFWPGPLTMIMKKRDIIPDEVSAGLSTVGIRFPEHKVARAVIFASDCPLAAPSANTSGKPSPTSAAHVYSDLNGKIPAIVDGGESGVGVESTVIDLTREKPRLLRPGGISKAQLESVLGEVEVDPAVIRSIENDAVVAAPGMKYRHYAPKAPVFILDGALDKACEFVASEDCAVLCFNEEEESFKKVCKNVISYGSEDKPETLARKLFDALRRFDDMEISKIYAREPQMGDGVELAVINRLQKSAGFARISV